MEPVHSKAFSKRLVALQTDGHFEQKYFPLGQIL